MVVRCAAVAECCQGEQPASHSWPNYRLQYSASVGSTLSLRSTPYPFFPFLSLPAPPFPFPWAGAAADRDEQQGEGRVHRHGVGRDLLLHQPDSAHRIHIRIGYQQGNGGLIRGHGQGVYVRACVYVCMYVCMYVYMSAWTVCAPVCVYVCECVR